MPWTDQEKIEYPELELEDLEQTMIDQKEDDYANTLLIMKLLDMVLMQRENIKLLERENERLEVELDESIEAELKARLCDD